MKEFKNLVTNYDQSKYILDMGFSKLTADQGTLSCPAWSLSRLVQLVPARIEKDILAYTFYLEMFDDDSCFLGYRDCEGSDLILYTTDFGSLMSSFCQLLSWLLLNGYIDKEYLRNE